MSTKNAIPKTTSSVETHVEPTKAPRPAKVEATVQELLRVKSVLEGALMDASKRGAQGEVALLKWFVTITLRRLRPFAKTVTTYEQA